MARAASLIQLSAPGPSAEAPIRTPFARSAIRITTCAALSVEARAVSAGSSGSSWSSPCPWPDLQVVPVAVEFGVDDPGDGAVVGGGVAAEQVGGQHPGLVVGAVCVGNEPGHVPGGPDPRLLLDLAALIDGDGSVVAKGDPQALQSGAVSGGPASRGQDYPLDGDGVAAFQG